MKWVMNYSMALNKTFLYVSVQSVFRTVKKKQKKTQSLILEIKVSIVFVETLCECVYLFMCIYILYKSYVMHLSFTLDVV